MIISYNKVHGILSIYLEITVHIILYYNYGIDKHFYIPAVSRRDIYMLRRADLS